MVTSTTYVYSPAALDIMTQSLFQLGVIGEDETPTPGMFSKGMVALNSLIKEWEASGIHVWTEEEAIVFLQQGQVRYLLGGTTTDNTSDAYSYILAQVATSCAAGATSIPLLTTLGIVSGQTIGVMLDTGFTWWTTVNGTPVGNTVVLTAALPSSATAQNYVFVYTTQIQRPLKVPKVRLLYYQGQREIPMTVMSRQEYMDLPNKYQPGTPTQFFYTPKRDQGEFYVWPNPQQLGATGAYGARITWYRPLANFISTANTADIPDEWVNALVWNLALELGPGYTIPELQWNRIVAMAATKLDIVQSWDRESEPVEFGYDTTYGQY